MMQRLLYLICLLAVLVPGSTLPALASEPSNLPPELRVPDGYKRVLTSVGRGVQIYDCVDAAWKFREPTAAIFDQRDRVVAIHYAGPTWQSIRDGSKVVGTLQGRHDAPDPQRDIAWLLLQGRSTGSGLFGDVDYIQRLTTEGGVAPAGPCTAGQTASVPYQATYQFWAPAK
jgi:Protein of unknown function (DUF3455)